MIKTHNIPWLLESSKEEQIQQSAQQRPCSQNNKFTCHRKASEARSMFAECLTTTLNDGYRDWCWRWLDRVHVGSLRWLYLPRRGMREEKPKATVATETNPSCYSCSEICCLSHGPPPDESAVMYAAVSGCFSLDVSVLYGCVVCSFAPEYTVNVLSHWARQPPRPHATSSAPQLMNFSWGDRDMCSLAVCSDTVTALCAPQSVCALYLKLF